MDELTGLHGDGPVPLSSEFRAVEGVIFWMSGAYERYGAFGEGDFLNVEEGQEDAPFVEHRVGEATELSPDPGQQGGVHADGVEGARSIELRDSQSPTEISSRTRETMQSHPIIPLSSMLEGRSGRVAVKDRMRELGIFEFIDFEFTKLRVYIALMGTGLCVALSLMILFSSSGLHAIESRVAHLERQISSKQQYKIPGATVPASPYEEPAQRQIDTGGSVSRIGRAHV